MEIRNPDFGYMVFFVFFFCFVFRASWMRYARDMHLVDFVLLHSRLSSLVHRIVASMPS